MRPVDMALDAGLVIMQNGGSTAAADRAFANVLAGCGTAGVTAVWRTDSVVADAGAQAGSPAIVRPVGPIGVNLSRVSEAIRLAERMAAGQIPAAEFDAELDRIRTLPSPYNRWMLIAAAVCGAGAFSQITGGDWGSLGVAAVAAGIGQFIRSLLQASRFPVAPVMLASGVVSALIAAIGVGLEFTRVVPATMIASVIYMVPGLPLINGFLDIASHRYLLVGIERTLNAAFLFLVLAIAIAIALAVTRSIMS